MELVKEIVDILVAGLTSIANGIGSGLGELTKSVFVAVDESGTITGLSTFGVVICVFAGVSLAIGLSTFIVKWVMSLGARN